MIDLKDLDRWQAWPKGKALTFGSEKARKLRVTVNAPQKTRIDVVLSGERGKLPTSYFLANVEGFRTIQFVAPGPVQLVASGDCAVYSSEFEETHFEIPDAVIFTKIAQRRHRNPELDLMMAKMTANMEKRLALAEQAMALRIQAITQAEHKVKERKDSENVAASEAGGNAESSVSGSDARAGKSGSRKGKAGSTEDSGDDRQDEA